MQQVTQLHINWFSALSRSTTYNSARRRSSSYSDHYVTMLKPTRGCQAVGCLHNTDSSYDSERCPPGFPTDASVKRSRGGGVWLPYPKGSDGILLWQRLFVNLMGMWWHAISSSYCIGCHSQGSLFIFSQSQSLSSFLMNNASRIYFYWWYVHTLATYSGSAKIHYWQTQLTRFCAWNIYFKCYLWFWEVHFFLEMSSVSLL